MPRGMSTFRLYFRALFGTFFLKFFLELDYNGKKDLCPVFGCNNDRLFSSLVLEIWSFTVYFSGKRRSLFQLDTWTLAP